MSGERTENSNPQGRGSTDDDISLREHLQRQIDLQRDNGIRMFAEFAKHYDSILEERSLIWNTRINDLNNLLTERQEMNDRRYEQRFEAQEKAVVVALTKVDKEFHEHLQSARDEVKASLDAADKAIGKSEAATEKRFEAVNEFRAQLTDQATRFMPRSESEVRMHALTDRADANANAINATAAIQSERINKLELSVTNRLAMSDGRGVGMDKLWGYIIGGIGLLSLIVTLFLKFTPSGS